MKSKAAMLWSNDDTEWTVEEVEIDEPKGRELLVRNVASGLCHSDEHFITGDFPLVNTPYIGGHEGSGVVEAVGPDVQGFEVGDHVVYSFVAACGICPFCADGHSNLCDNGAAIMGGLMLDGTSRIHVKGQDASVMAGLGTFAAHSVVHEWSAVKVLPDLPLDKLVLLGCGATTGWGSAVYAADVRPGDNVAVVGVGGLGSAAVQGARLAGAERIFAIDPVEFKREMAMQLGATHVYSSVDEALLAVPELSWGEMCDRVILSVGVVHGDMVDPALALTAKGGTMVVTGLAPMVESDAKLNLFMLSMLNKEVKGTIFGSTNPRAAIPNLLSMYREGRLKIDELITRRYSLDEVNEGYQDLRDGKIIRGVIEFGG